MKISNEVAKFSGSKQYYDEGENGFATKQKPQNKIQFTLDGGEYSETGSSSP